MIYIVKENRTYDQVLGDLEVGNGDPRLTVFGRAMTPNQHALAREFVDLDAFFDSGESSNTGWNWSTAGAHQRLDRARGAGELRRSAGLQYDQEGANRNVNVGYAPPPPSGRTPTRFGPTDPDILPGARDVAAPDGPGGDEGRGYLWDAALRAGLSRAQLRLLRRPDPLREARRAAARIAARARTVARPSCRCSTPPRPR